MNVIKIYGGLANQFFQYAFGKAMEANGIKVGHELSFYDRPHDPLRPYGLDKFYTTTNPSKFLQQRTIHETTSMHYKCEPSLLMMNNTNFFGYWQHPGYFKSILPILKKELTLREEYYTDVFLRLREKILNQESTVALHVRRGDYVTIAGHLVLPLDYYDQALQKVRGYVYIFSDDIPWCKNHFSHHDSFRFIEQPDFICFELMKLCTHKIIANSTFSLMAALLSQRQDGKVIAPVKWRVNEEEQRRVEQGGLLLNNWIKL